VSVGEELSRARQERRLTVDDVAADTMIRATLIRAIEADNFDPCGGSVYARGHIRSIARVVGIDPKPLLAEFDSTHEGAAPAALTLAAAPTDHEAVARSERHNRGPNWAAAMVAVLVLVVVAALVPFIAGHHGSNKPSSNAGAGPVTHPSTTPSPAASPSHSASPPPSATAQLNTNQASMLIRVTKDSTWMSVETVAGSVLFEGLLPAGHQKLFTAKHGLKFVIGNAPAVDIVVNGHDIGSPASSGNVSRGTVTPGANTVQAA
jgi:transcriptional regulator with XRE-family HTH domain